jgi:hypothetical protein
MDALSPRLHNRVPRAETQEEGMCGQFAEESGTFELADGEAVAQPWKHWLRPWTRVRLSSCGRLNAVGPR